MYTITVEPALEAGRTYVVDMEFKGLLKGSLYGFYRSSYKDKTGNKMYVLSNGSLLLCYVLWIKLIVQCFLGNCCFTCKSGINV